MKFKVGDTVKIRETLIVGSSYNGYLFIEAMAKYKGCTATIIDKYQEFYSIDVDYNSWAWTDGMFESLKFTKKDIKSGDILTRRDGTIAIVGEGGDVAGYGYKFTMLTDTLENTGCAGSEYDIVKVERPIGYDVVYVREEETKTNEELHREMWRWLAEHPDKSKEDWFEETKTPRVYSDCFACREAENGVCGLCPLDEDVIGCIDGHGLWAKWNESTDMKVKAALASVIAELPWRSKNEK